MDTLSKIDSYRLMFYIVWIEITFGCVVSKIGFNSNIFFFANQV